MRRLLTVVLARLGEFEASVAAMAAARDTDVREARLAAALEEGRAVKAETERDAARAQVRRGCSGGAVRAASRRRAQQVTSLQAEADRLSAQVTALETSGAAASAEVARLREEVAKEGASVAKHKAFIKRIEERAIEQLEGAKKVRACARVCLCVCCVCVCRSLTGAHSISWPHRRRPRKKARRWRSVASSMHSQSALGPLLDAPAPPRSACKRSTAA